MTIFNQEFKEQIKSQNRMFICGIGGIGTSGLALLAKDRGYIVTGSNEINNKNTEKLKSEGIDVKIGHSAENLNNSNIFVYSAAIDLSTNLEAIEAKALQIPMFPRGKMLSLLMRDYFNIVVAGSHGKTTTTGLIGHMLQELKQRPNILVGGVLNSCHSNCQIGGSEYFVVESDESDGSFLEMPANIGIITNVDPEHMEFYKTFENLEYYFYRFAKKILDNKGHLIICIDDQVGNDVIEKLKGFNGYVDNVITYSAKNDIADFFVKNVRFETNGLRFDIVNNKDKTSAKDVFLSNMYGEINALNVAGCFAVGYVFNYKLDQIANTFANFEGIQKRFSVLGKLDRAILVDDYAHNPQKISAAINSARHYMKCHNMKGKLNVVFEPHRYTRIRDGLKLFIESFKNVDNVIVLPIYASSEHPIEGITQDFIVKQLQKVNQNIFSCELNSRSVAKLLKEQGLVNEGDIIVFMGAGCSSKIAHEIAKMVN